MLSKVTAKNVGDVFLRHIVLTLYSTALPSRCKGRLINFSMMMTMMQENSMLVTSITMYKIWKVGVNFIAQ